MSKELLDLILAGKNAEAADVFDSAVSARIADKLDAVKAEIGGSVFEESEELEEVSKKLLGRYVKAAADDMANKEATGFMNKSGSDTQRMHFKKSDKRGRGISKAVDKMTKEETEFSDEDIVESHVLAKHGDVTVTRKKRKDGSSYTDVHHKRKGVMDRGQYDRDSDAFWFHRKKGGGDRAFNSGKDIAKHYAKEALELEAQEIAESKEQLQKEIEAKKKAGKFKPYSKLSMRLNFKK